MTNETMTVHEALCELKIISSRIYEAINQTFVVPNKNTSKNVNGVPVENVIETFKSRYQKVTDLIKRRNAIKKAVTLSNATATVVIEGVTYTVAEAIEMNNSGITYKEQLRDELLKQYNAAQREVKVKNSEAEVKADKYIADTFGREAQNGTSKSDAAAIEDARAAYLNSISYGIIDPINVAKKIEELEEEISKFKTKVNSALSVSNATTTITIEY
jgi:hypothetical protein